MEGYALRHEKYWENLSEVHGQSLEILPAYFRQCTGILGNTARIYCIGNSAADTSMMSLSIRQLGKKSVKFLGHICGSGKYSPDPEKVETIRKLSGPTTKSEVRNFLGITCYYRDYIPNFSQLVLPLRGLGTL
ncbi:retrovirus-related Pol polyprotein from transposon 17.6 [Trichonephila clavipes]|uniref:Retrovirus-related Pol polyprotein from transposon 17.6 n=1 Tax=Trichonephila clavipes TaxID=2585209 RepID=A0A8X6SXC9_TRICX|nr:retrovirus-related Pol polyprotein from transposon 17.6 [Trichonephila clavipes]